LILFVGGCLENSFLLTSIIYLKNAAKVKRKSNFFIVYSKSIFQ
jgi:hypothetical protein